MEGIGDDTGPAVSDIPIQGSLAASSLSPAPHGSPEAEAVLVRAVRLLDAGDHRAALDSADEALALDADRAEAHYARGQGCAALGRHAEAADSFFAAGRLRPGWADAWVNHGLARYALGDVEGAKRAMQGALRARPGHPAASANLAALLRITGHREKAEETLLGTLARDPGSIAARLNLAGELIQEDRVAEALAILDEAELPDTDEEAVRHWHLQRASALAGLSRPEEARDALDRFDALGPTPPALATLRRWRLVVIALAEGRLASARAEARATERILEEVGGALLPEHRLMTHFDLAKLWSRFDDRPRAFDHWIAGHRLLRPLQPFSRQAAARFHDAAIEVFTPERLATGPRASNRDPAPVFVVGMPRSGTTLCEQIIAAHRDAHGAGERSALFDAFHAVAGGDGPDGVARLATLDGPALDAVAERYLADLHALAPDASRVVDKMPSNYRLVWLIALLFPAARIIHCTRDPRDIGLSIFTFRFYGHHGYAHDLGDLGWTIAEHSRIMDHWKAVLSNQVLTVALSDWVDDFDATLARVLGFLDLPHDPNCARFYENEGRVHTASRAQVRQPINARGIGRWRVYEKELAPLIAELERPRGDAPSSERPERMERPPERSLRMLRPSDPHRSLGMAVSYLMTRLDFAALPFGQWSLVLAGQVRRGHCAFVVDGDDAVRGFVGWSLTTRERAEAWVEDRSDLSFADALAGDCVAFNIWAADDRAAHRFLVDEARRLVEHKAILYWKRRYPDGRRRAVRLRVSPAVSSHIRSAAPYAEPRATT